MRLFPNGLIAGGRYELDRQINLNFTLGEGAVSIDQEEQIINILRRHGLIAE